MTLKCTLTTLALVALAARAGRADDAGPAEAAPATTAQATTASAPKAPRAIVLHLAPLESSPGEPIELAVQIDAPFAETLTVRWRAVGEQAWHDVELERSLTSGWSASLPATSASGVEYYLRGVDHAGSEVTHFASAEAPHVVRVVPSLVDRLEVVDRARLLDRKNAIAFDIVGHNFGNRYGLDDRYVRAELAYTRRMLRELHQVTFGFGSISGTTPLMSLPVEEGGDDDGKSLRYGFGEVRLRAHPYVFFDARASIGASHEGLDGGVRGAVTFGKPWRSSVSIGGEYLGDLGPSAWVRLQWDTAPPLLMGASVVRTNLPGAVIDAAGLYIAYDIAYRYAERWSLRAQVSYGARDGGSKVGGGFGTGVDF